jgi:flavin-binding protein dodecin
VLATWRGPQGAFSLFSPAPRVLVVKLTGVTDQSAAPAIEKALDSAFAADDRLQVFWDLGEHVNYHSDVRVYCTRVLLKHRPHFAALHAYSRSRIVSMGVAVANLAIGGIAQIHTSQEHFDAALSAAVATKGAPT